MKKEHVLPLLILVSLLGSLELSNASLAFADQPGSDMGLQALEAVHKQNIGQLHDLHHEMRASLKQLTRGGSDQEAGQQLTVQLRAVKQVLDVVAGTEKDHPQWPLNWSQRHARLVVLTQEMEALLLTGPSGRNGSRTLDQLGKKLREMKEILDIW